LAPELSLIVPCYQEASHLRKSVEVLRGVLDRSGLDYEVVFVDDGSTDGTRDILAEIVPACERFRCILHEKNRGRGGAVKTGFAATTGRVAGFIDIDLEVHPLYIPEMVGRIQREGFDVVTGRRIYLLSQTRGVHRHVMSIAYRRLCHFLIGFGVQDSETGYKFFKRETASRVVLGSESDGWFWDTEVMARAALANLSIQEMPVLFQRRFDKKSTVRLVRDSWAYLVALHGFRAKVGLSLLHTSPIYWTGVGYDLVMRLLYGRELARTHERVAALVPEGSSVVDVCAGTCRLYLDQLRARRCEYLGLDFNGHLLMSARRRGARARSFQVLRDEIPEADYVVMCSSLYHFHERVDEVLEQLQRAARKAVIVSEPVKNLTTMVPAGLRRLVSSMTNPGVGKHGYRFDLESFRAFATRHAASEFRHEKGWRNAVAVFARRG
jgi:glycosyltransferase involved in cell wall biosynthesis